MVKVKNEDKNAKIVPTFVPRFHTSGSVSSSPRSLQEFQGPQHAGALEGAHRPHKNSLKSGRFTIFHGSLVISIIFNLVFSEVGTKLRKYWGSS